MRNMSFSLTIKPMIDRTKDVTRRFGWWFLKPGDRLWAVEKAMGLKKNQKIKRLYPIEVVSTRSEKLISITKDECIREGFPDYEPKDFILMMANKYGQKVYSSNINRIEFKEITL